MTLSDQAVAFVRDLREHPDNSAVYGEPDLGLLESVIECGILTPLLVTKDNVVVAGHRRLAAARKAGLATVPVVRLDKDDELDVREAMVHANKARQKTNEQLAREAQVLREVERERAKRRIEEGNRRGAQSVNAKLAGRSVEPVPPSANAGKSRDRVGAALGVSGRTADRLASAADAIDRLRADGKTEEAEAVRNVLNEKGVRAAGRAAASLSSGDGGPQLWPSPEGEPSETSAPSSANNGVAAAVRAFLNCKAQVGDLRRAIAALAAMPGGEELAKLLRKTSRGLSCQAMDDLATMVFLSQPVAVGCPVCDGARSACQLCFGRGWICRRIWKQLSSDHRAKIRSAVAADEGVP